MSQSKILWRPSVRDIVGGSIDPILQKGHGMWNSQSSGLVLGLGHSVFSISSSVYSLILPQTSHLYSTGSNNTSSSSIIVLFFTLTPFLVWNIPRRQELGEQNKGSRQADQVWSIVQFFFSTKSQGFSDGVLLFHNPVLTKQILLGAVFL
jgi:hypothetical protein